MAKNGLPILQGGSDTRMAGEQVGTGSPGENIREWLKLFASRLQKLIGASGGGEMIGDCHDCGRLLKVNIL